MNKYRTRKLVNGLYRFDVKRYREVSIPFTFWSVILPFWTWDEWPTAYETEQAALDFIQKLAQIDAGSETLASETRYYTHKGERCMDSWM